MYLQHNGLKPVAVYSDAIFELLTFDQYRSDMSLICSFLQFSSIETLNLLTIIRAIWKKVSRCIIPLKDMRRFRVSSRKRSGHESLGELRSLWSLRMKTNTV